MTIEPDSRPLGELEGSGLAGHRRGRYSGFWAPYPFIAPKRRRLSRHG